MVNFLKAVGKRQKLNKIIDEKVVRKTNKILTDDQSEKIRNKELHESIRYAVRIQEALMLKEKHLKRIIPESFILNLPKDHVSGDFYWFTKLNGKIIIAVADCTGHGIPGAFMSVLGVSLLNQIVLEDNISDPSQILFRLDQKLKKAFAPDEEAPRSNDGMDIGLVMIDLFSSEVTFTGAMRNLLVVSPNQLNEYKGNRYPIGGLRLEKERYYPSLTFKIEKGARLFLFTDGYADQFGGSKKKKLMTSRLKGFLMESRVLPIELQKDYLKKFFLDWRGEEEQVDDVLILGVEI